MPQTVQDNLFLTTTMEPANIPFQPVSPVLSQRLLDQHVRVINISILTSADIIANLAILSFDPSERVSSEILMPRATDVYQYLHDFFPIVRFVPLQSVWSYAWTKGPPDADDTPSLVTDGHKRTEILVSRDIMDNFADVERSEKMGTSKPDDFPNWCATGSVVLQSLDH